MGNLLNLELDNNDAIVLASPYQNINDRKEIYLKYLIISALKSQADIVDVQDSLFYSRKFYSLTRLFDFYVNNNVFDLIILKPDEDETLFDIVLDEIHSNIYGYAVARISKNFKSAELLGYFMSKDFDKVVSGKCVKVASLIPINDFEDVEIMDSQMSLDDVSERYFELLSGFMDDDLDESGLAEFACLLYNSCELREVFSEIGRFDSICEEMNQHAELLNDDFLSVFDGEMAQKIIEKNAQERVDIEISQGEEYLLDNLSELAEEEPLSLDTEEIDLSADLEILSEIEENAQDSIEQETIESEIQSIEEYTEEVLVDEVEELLDEENISELVVDEDLELLLETSESIEKETEVECLSHSDDFSLANISEIMEEKEENSDLDLESLANEENDDEVSDELIEDTIEINEEILLDELEEQPSLEMDEISKEEDSLILEEVSDDEALLEFNEEDGLNDNIVAEIAVPELEFDVDVNSNEDSMSAENDESEDGYETSELGEYNIKKPSSRLKAELAALSLKLKQKDFENILVSEYTEEPDNQKNIEIVETLPATDTVEIVEEIQQEEKERSVEIEQQSKDENIELDEILELQFESTKEVDEDLTIITDSKVEDGVEVLSDELMELLNDNSGIEFDVNDNELVEILQESDVNLESEQFIETVETIDKHTLQHIQNEMSVSEEEQEALIQNQEDLSLLYNQTSESTDITADEEIDELNAMYKKAQEKAAKQKKGMLIVAVVALLVVLSTVLMPQPKNSKSTVNSIKENEVMKKNNVTKPVETVANKNIVDEFKNEEKILSMKNVVEKQETKIETSLTKQVGGAPVILKSVAWQVPTSISRDVVFNKYLQIAGKNIKLNLATDLLDTDDFAYNNKIKISMIVKNNTPVKNIKVVESSGSKNVDEIVLQSIKQTLKYINTPVMSEDSGDREVILVISI